ncbi:DUF159-domain-containing protein, partial [Tribonema minus]
MCGRAAALVEPQAVARATGLPGNVPTRRTARFRPSCNVHPGQNVPVLYHAYAPEQQQEQEKGGGSGHQDLEVASMVWGLVPSFSKPEDKPNFFRMFNARSETVNSKSIFKRLMAKRRAVVAFDGFYEWKKDAAGEKQPYFIHYEDGRPMLMAALYDRARRPTAFERPSDAPEEDDPDHLYTFTILTTDSSPRLAWLHDRMPAVISAEAARRWLHAGVDAASALSSIAPNDSADIVWHPVSKRMNSVKYQGEDCMEPVE